jgi:hypothetical protein
MVGGPIVLATVYYIIWGRKTYSPPNETVEDYMERYEAATASSEKEVIGGVAEESVCAAEKREDYPKTVV